MAQFLLLNRNPTAGPSIPGSLPPPLLAQLERAARRIVVVVAFPNEQHAKDTHTLSTSYVVSAMCFRGGPAHKHRAFPPPSISLGPAPSEPWPAGFTLCLAMVEAHITSSAAGRASRCPYLSARHPRQPSRRGKPPSVHSLIAAPVRAPFTALAILASWAMHSTRRTAPATRIEVHPRAAAVS